MKFKKTIILFIVLLVIIVIAVKSKISANNENRDTSVSRDRTSVILVKDEENEQLVHVCLGLKDDESIASFQIGLDIDLTNKAEVSFNWNENLSQGKFRDYTYNSNSDDLTDKSIERLNIYYVGTQELNPDKKDTVEIGTIKINLDKKATVKISPDAEFTTAATIGHAATEFIIEDVDTLQYILNDKKTDSSGDDNKGDDENSGDADDSGNKGDLSGDKDSGSQVSQGDANQNQTEEVQEDNKQNDKENNKLLPSLYPKTGIVWVDNVLFTIEILIVVAIILCIIRKRNRNRRKARRGKH